MTPLVKVNQMPNRTCFHISECYYVLYATPNCLRQFPESAHLTVVMMSIYTARYLFSSPAGRKGLFNSFHLFSVDTGLTYGY